MLRWLLVTPAMHRVHHSWHPDETSLNFGINQFRDPRELRLERMLWQPLRGAVDSYPINARATDADGTDHR